MFSGAKNGRIPLAGTTMDYVSFGNGKRALVLIPGLGDGLKTVRGMALPVSVMYRDFASEYRVYVFSRKNQMEPGCSTENMAADVKAAMDVLGIEKADMVGVSLGGMIAQQFAADYPETIGKLVLAVTASRANEHLGRTIPRWIGMAEQGAYRELMTDTVRSMYSDEYLRKNRWMLPIIGRFGKPASYARFIAMAQACIRHDCHERLRLIKADTLVIGGEKDQVVGGQASHELAEGIPGSRLVMYPQYGHAVYEEAKDFNQTILDFLTRQIRPCSAAEI